MKGKENFKKKKDNKREKEKEGRKGKGKKMLRGKDGEQKYLS